MSSSWSVHLDAEATTSFTGSSAVADADDAIEARGFALVASGNLRSQPVPNVFRVSSYAINRGAGLTVEPGTTLAFSGGLGMSLFTGTLIAVGTDEAPIRFTSADAATGGTGARGQSGCVDLDGGGDHRLEHVSIEYAGAGRGCTGGELRTGLNGVVQGAALRDVTFREIQGAAMTAALGLCSASLCAGKVFTSVDVDIACPNEMPIDCP